MISSSTAIERALRQIQPLTQGRVQETQLRSAATMLLKSALEIASKRIAENETSFQSLQADFTVTPTAGRINLAAIDGILFDLDKARVRDSATNKTFFAIDSLETLENGDLPTDQVYYSSDGQEVIFRDTNGSTTAYNTETKIKANYIMSFDDADRPIPLQHEALVINALAELTMSQVPELVAAQSAIAAQAGSSTG